MPSCRASRRILVFGEILAGCGPRTAPLIADLIAAHREGIEDLLLDIVFLPEDLKAISVLLAAGFRIEDRTIEDDYMRECLASLLKRSETAHGRLSLMAEARDLAGLLARSRFEAFFGLRNEDGEIVPFREGADETTSREEMGDSTFRDISE